MMDRALHKLFVVTSHSRNTITTIDLYTLVGYQIDENSFSVRRPVWIINQGLADEATVVV